MEKIVIPGYEANLSITDISGNYHLIFDCNLNNDVANEVVYNFSILASDAFWLNNVFSGTNIITIEDRNQNIELDIGVIKDGLLEMYFELKDYSSETPLAKRYKIYIQKDNPQYEKFKTIFDMMIQKEKGSMEDEYKSYSFKY